MHTDAHAQAHGHGDTHGKYFHTHSSTPMSVHTCAFIVILELKAETSLTLKGCKVPRGSHFTSCRKDLRAQLRGEAGGPCSGTTTLSPHTTLHHLLMPSPLRRRLSEDALASTPEHGSIREPGRCRREDAKLRMRWSRRRWAWTNDKCPCEREGDREEEAE